VVPLCFFARFGFRSFKCPQMSSGASRHHSEYANVLSPGLLVLMVSAFDCKLDGARLAVWALGGKNGHTYFRVGAHGSLRLHIKERRPVGRPYLR
jgi:hypothetical protein